MDWVTFEGGNTLHNHNQLKQFSVLLFYMGFYVEFVNKIFLTAVESLEASVISRLPLSPSSAGTRMNTSDTSVNTVQCCNDHHVTSATQHQHNEHTAILKRDISDSR